MTEIGEIVSAKDDNTATVRFLRKGECDRCLICKVTKEGAHVELNVKNSLELNVGDFVKVEVYNNRVHASSILIYLIPLILTALGAGLGLLASLGASILLAIAGIVVGLAFAVPIDVFVLRKNSAPKMIEVCSETDYINAKPKPETDEKSRSPKLKDNVKRKTKEKK